jgi:hypothetical protein
MVWLWWSPDLHSDWDVTAATGIVLWIVGRGKADVLSLLATSSTGGSKTLDRSLEIVLDVLALQATCEQAVVPVRQSQMPHIYGISLAK